MKFWREKLGCLIWVAAILFLSAGGGWGANKYFASISWMPVWANIILSVVIGIIVLIVLGVTSYLILTVTDKDYEKNSPDFSGKV